ncbi:MAG TPA: VWA domain-containing protein [Pyrinomonadaceae bacterium]|jgi:VWFA-related protein|nr:VWA domain-containing protein [Pyrinomonadaceae bacterium]
MRLSLARAGFAVFVVVNLLVVNFAAGAAAQTGQGAQKNVGAQKANVQRDAPAKKPATKKADEDEETEAESTSEQQGPEDVLKVETDLVAVPVIATDRDDVYVPDLRQDEFTVYEDGVKQEVVFFATVSAPFHVVLMIDTSASTQEKLRQIQSAAISFVEELQPGDKVKVISFDDKIRDSGEFTSDHTVLNAAIRRTAPGKGTKLYDAMTLALGSLGRVRTRKAVVIFTDGVDWHSDGARYEDNIRALEESGIIVYPIRYDTRLDTERIARQQAESGQRVDLGEIFGTGSSRGKTTPTATGGSPFPDSGSTSRRGGATPTTVPGGDGIPLPDGGGGIGSRLPPIISPRRTDTNGRRGGDDPNIDIDPQSPRNRRGTGTSWPDDRDDGSVGADRRYPRTTTTTSGGRDGSATGTRSNDSITNMLNMAYLTADGYLKDLADKSGGELYRADTLLNLADVFSQIAAELRTQYSIGYYPSNRARDGKYRKIQVRTTRKDVSVRARPGYRTPTERQK